MKSDAVVRRVQAVLLLTLVLSVPALTRATQHLKCIASGHEPSGFSTSADSAPERVTVSADLQLLPATACVVVAPERRDELARRPDEPLPSPPLIAAARPLRAPPSPVLIS